MAWAAPLYSRSRVTQAGKQYVDPATSPEDRQIARAVINNWRSSHGFPLNTLQVNLRDIASRFDRDPTVAQRIKRLPSIRHKLERFPRMELAGMQDIGGARAVVSSQKVAERVVDYYLASSRIKHKLVREDRYVDEPKPSGYRGFHLVYRYYSDRKDTYNGLKIELQVRSRFQHAWATAVETVGTFTRQALKSSWGDEHWLRFFALMSSALALREGTAPVPGTPTDRSELISELQGYAARLKVVERLQAYGAVAQHVERDIGSLKGYTFLLELDVDKRVLDIRAFDKSPAAAAMAAEEYSAIEQAIEGIPEKDVVLVTAESLVSLQRAYPNYFLDTTAFVETLEETIA
jgi:hypothetical protein